MARNKDKNKKLAISERDTLDIILHGKSGVLAILGKDGNPYTITTAYVCSAGKIYFRAKGAGYNLDTIKCSCKASFCVIDKGKVDKETMTTIFRTALAYGDLKPVTSPNEKEIVAEKLESKYNPNKKDDKPAPTPTDGEDKGESDVVEAPKPVDISLLVFSIEHISGQESNQVISIRGVVPAAPSSKKPAMPKKKKAKKGEKSEDDEETAKSEKEPAKK